MPAMPDIEVGSKRSSTYDEYGEIDEYKKSKPDDQKVRLLLVGRFCGALIGKGGENMKRLRVQNSVKINGLNTRTNDRVLSIEGDKENIINVIREILIVCNEGPYPANTTSKCTFELNLLVNTDQIGLIVGKGGSKIKEIADESSGKVKIYQDCLPNSNERVVAIGGDDEGKLTSALQIILDIIGNNPRKSQTMFYEPGNTNLPMGGIGVVNQTRHGGGIPTNNGAPMVNNDVNVAAVLINKLEYIQRNGVDPERPDFTQVQTESKLIVPNDMCGAIIGKGGQNIRTIRQSSGAKLSFTEAEKGSKEDRTITITGTQGQVQIAEQLMTQFVRGR